MTGEPVFERLWHDVTSHLPHHHNPEGTTMSAIDDLSGVLTDIETVTADAYNKAKTAVEQHLPGIAATITKVEGDPFIQALLGANLAVPEHLVGLAVDFLTKLVQVAPADPGQQSAA
jgi:hypothetical protein